MIKWITLNFMLLQGRSCFFRLAAGGGGSKFQTVCGTKVPQRDAGVQPRLGPGGLDLWSVERLFSHIGPMQSTSVRFLFPVCVTRLKKIVHFGVICLSLCKFYAESYPECMKCVPTDTNITSTGHSRNPLLAHFSRDLRESHGSPLAQPATPPCCCNDHSSD